MLELILLGMLGATTITLIAQTIDEVTRRPDVRALHPGSKPAVSEKPLEPSPAIEDVADERKAA